MEGDRQKASRVYDRSIKRPIVRPLPVVCPFTLRLLTKYLHESIHPSPARHFLRDLAVGLYSFSRIFLISRPRRPPFDELARLRNRIPSARGREK